MSRAVQEAAKWIADKWPGKADAAQDGYITGFKQAVELAAETAEQYPLTRTEAEDGEGGNVIAEAIRKLDS